MKLRKGLAITLSILTLIGSLLPSATAKDTPNTAVTTEVELLPNGDRIETELITYEQPEGAKSTAGYNNSDYTRSAAFSALPEPC